MLSTQLDKASAIRSFARDLALVSDTLVSSDSGPAARDRERVTQPPTSCARFLEENKVDLAKLLNNLVTTGEVQVAHLDDIEMLMIAYPYVVAGGFAVNDKTPETGLYDAHFGLILTEHNLCKNGYQGTDRRPPQQTREPADERAGPLRRVAGIVATPAASRTHNRVAPGSGPDASRRTIGTRER